MSKVVSRAPLYIQLRERLRAKIRRGEYAPGTAIPSESRLAETYGLHRLSVRNAVDSLADEGLLIYNPQNITSAQEETVADGIKVTHVYDPAKIGAKVEEGEVTGFRAEYYFDEDGELEYFTEITDAENNGEKETYAYRIDITEKNSVDKVENTVEQFIKDK